MHDEYFDDSPTLVDELDRAALVRRVAAVVAHCQPPAAFGVHGDWGAGKTSFLRQLRYHLTGERDAGAAIPATIEPSLYRGNVVTVWFESWRYQHEAVPVVALLQEMRRQFSQPERLKLAGIAGITPTHTQRHRSD